MAAEELYAMARPGKRVLTFEEGVEASSTFTGGSGNVVVHNGVRNGTALSEVSVPTEVFQPRGDTFIFMKKKPIGKDVSIGARSHTTVNYATEGGENRTGDIKNRPVGKDVNIGDGEQSQTTPKCVNENIGSHEDDGEFYLRKQNEGESVREFAEALRHLAASCHNQKADKELVKQFIDGLNDRRVKIPMMRHGGRTFDDVADRALDMESVLAFAWN